MVSLLCMRMEHGIGPDPRGRRILEPDRKVDCSENQVCRHLRNLRDGTKGCRNAYCISVSCHMDVRILLQRTSTVDFATPPCHICRASQPGRDIWGIQHRLDGIDAQLEDGHMLCHAYMESGTVVVEFRTAIWSVLITHIDRSHVGLAGNIPVGEGKV